MSIIASVNGGWGHGSKVEIRDIGAGFVHVETTAPDGKGLHSVYVQEADRKALAEALLSTVPSENAAAPKEDGVFQEGDKVRIVAFGEDFNGAVGHIEEIDAYLNVYVTDTSGSVAQHILNDTVPCLADELEHFEGDDVTALADAVLAPAEKVEGVFNVGDRVVLVDDFDPEEDSPSLGVLGTVDELFPEHGDILVTWDYDGESLCKAGELEHNPTDDYAVFLERVERAARAYPGNPDLADILMILATGFLLDESPEATAALRELVG